MPLTQSIPQSHHSPLSAAGQLGPVSINSSHNIPHQCTVHSPDKTPTQSPPSFLATQEYYINQKICILISISDFPPPDIFENYFDLATG